LIDRIIEREKRLRPYVLILSTLRLAALTPTARGRVTAQPPADRATGSCQSRKINKKGQKSGQKERERELYGPQLRLNVNSRLRREENNVRRPERKLG
jgi:hypothetical protein